MEVVVEVEVEVDVGGYVVDVIFVVLVWAIELASSKESRTVSLIRSYR